MPWPSTSRGPVPGPGTAAPDLRQRRRRERRCQHGGAQRPGECPRRTASAAFIAAQLGKGGSCRDPAPWSPASGDAEVAADGAQRDPRTFSCESRRRPDGLTTDREGEITGLCSSFRPRRGAGRSVCPLGHRIGTARKGQPQHIQAASARSTARASAPTPPTGRDWPTIGLDHAETRLSKLAQRQRRQRQGPGLVWSYNLESTRGVEATPLVVDGVMYLTASWSIVHAIDVRTGKRLWIFDPKVPRD